MSETHWQVVQGEKQIREQILHNVKNLGAHANVPFTLL